MLRLLLLLGLLLPLCAQAQDDDRDTSRPQKIDSVAHKKQITVDEDLINLGMEDFKSDPRGSRGVRITFYNVENLFDIYNDSLTKDDDFTPEGIKHWNYSRYHKKLSNIYKVLMAVGGWGGPPELVGFCEIENRLVLEDLLDKTPLYKYKYGIVNEPSIDARGIEVGFIYQKSKFKYVSHEAIRLRLPNDTTFRTRDILYVKGIVLGKDSLHVFVNHWPSRLGGQAASEHKRILAANKVRHKVDSIYARDPNAKIVIMGDLNDHAEDKSVAEVLRAKGSTDGLAPNDLYNFMAALGHNWKLGSHKYQGHWGTLDHVIVSSPLLSESRSGKLIAGADGAHIFAARFLMEEDRRYMGLQPFRTYAGPRFIDGFSDHLPVYLDIWVK